MSEHQEKSTVCVSSGHLEYVLAKKESHAWGPQWFTKRLVIRLHMRKRSMGVSFACSPCQRHPATVDLSILRRADSKMCLRMVSLVFCSWWCLHTPKGQSAPERLRSFSIARKHTRPFRSDHNHDRQIHQISSKEVTRPHPFTSPLKNPETDDPPPSSPSPPRSSSPPPPHQPQHHQRPSPPSSNTPRKVYSP